MIETIEMCTVVNWLSYFLWGNVHVQKGLEWIVSFVFARLSGCQGVRTWNSVIEGSSNRVIIYW